MSASPPLPGDGPAPAPPAPPRSDGGDDDDHDCSPLLDLLQRFPDLFEKYVLERLDPAARSLLARTGRAFLDAVYPRYIFPFGLPLAQETTGGVAARVFKLVHFLGSIERLAWAKANGCPWESWKCTSAARSGHLEVLQWARQHGCPWSARPTPPRGAGTWRFCAGRGSTTARGTG